MAINSSLQKLRLKYYWQGIVLHDIVSLVGKRNIMYASCAMRKSRVNKTEKFYYVSRQSIVNGSMNYSTTPVMSNCALHYFNTYKLDNRCIVISGDTNNFKAMLIGDSSGAPVVLGRESFAIRFKTAEDAVSAHAWFLSEEVSSAIRATLREKSAAMNKSSIRITMNEIMELPIPSTEWLNNNYANGMLKAKCIGLGSNIVSSLQGANISDPMYEDILGLLETAVKKIGQVSISRVG